MILTARRLNRATLERQLLLEREPLDVGEAVRRVVALQAQEAASPYVALWNRVAGFAPDELDRAFLDGSVVKASLMRITLHAVTAGDYPTFHEAMQRTLRAARLGDRRFTSTGLATSDADRWVPDLVAFLRRPRTNAEVEAWLGERLDAGAAKWLWWALRQAGPFIHHPTGGPWSFGPRPAYVAARDRPPGGDPAAAMDGLIRRYLEGFGPASVADIAQYGMLYKPPVREALARMAGELERCEGPGGVELYDIPGRPLPPEDSPAPPRLLGMWDSVLLVYADRSRIIPPEYRKLVMRINGDSLPTLLVDGYVAGVWRPADGGIEATAFHALPDEAWVGLESEARSLGALMAARDPALYRRYGHWWKNLPAGEVRVLGD